MDFRAYEQAVLAYANELARTNNLIDGEHAVDVDVSFYRKGVRREEKLRSVIPHQEGRTLQSLGCSEHVSLILSRVACITTLGELLERCVLIAASDDESPDILYYLDKESTTEWPRSVRGIGRKMITSLRELVDGLGYSIKTVPDHNALRALAKAYSLKN